VCKIVISIQKTTWPYIHDENMLINKIDCVGKRVDPCYDERCVFWMAQVKDRDNAYGRKSLPFSESPMTTHTKLFNSRCCNLVSRAWSMEINQYEGISHAAEKRSWIENVILAPYTFKTTYSSSYIKFVWSGQWLSLARLKYSTLCHKSTTVPLLSSWIQLKYCSFNVKQ